MQTLRTLALLVAVTVIGVSVSAPACQASTESRLAMAVRHKDLPVVLKLLADGDDVNERDEGMEQTPLMRAVQLGDPQIVRALLEHKADVNAQDDEGNTALMLAASQGSARVVQLLLEYGAIPDRRSEGGTTAFSIARSKGHMLIARLIERAALQHRIRPQQLALRGMSDRG